MRPLLEPDQTQPVFDWIDARLPDLASLSTGELNVLRTLALGASNAAIANALVVSERTVESHIHSIFVKLGLLQCADENRRVIAAVVWTRAVS
ncbi:helix-turn-helix domain-containing protein [Agromyces sp. NPDC055520]